MILERIWYRHQESVMKDIVLLLSLLYNVKLCEILRIFELIEFICIALRK
jgi:hypothetical protein